MTPVYAAAYDIYWTLGWRGVLPLPPRKKKHPPKDYTGHAGRYPSYPDILQWSETYPDGNLCVRVHEGVIGIDVDNYGDKPGGQTITDCESRWGRLPYSPRSTSRQEDGDTVSGIRLYRVPAGIKFVDRLPGVEIIQPHHRYVICWPSIHPDTGRQYRWYGVDGGELAAPPGLGDLPELPPAWIEGLRKEVAHNEPGREGVYNVADAITEGEMSRRVAHKLSLAMAEVHQSECRHDSIRDRVLGILRCGKQGEPGVKVALQALREAFANKVGPDRPGGRQEAIEEFNDFVAGERVQQLLAVPDYDDLPYNLSEPPPDLDDHHVGEYAAADRDTAAEPDQTPVLAGAVLTRSALLELPDPEPLIDGMLDQGTVALLYGPWGVGKSFIAFDCGACVATGRPWQGRYTEQRRVLYVAAEGAYGLKGRTAAWEQGWHTKIADGSLDILPRPVNLTNTAEVRNLAALIEWGGYSFVILDTLARCMVGADENSAKDCGVVVDALHRLRQHTPGGRGVVQGVHHTGKDGKTFRGSSAFEAGADTVYSCTLDGAVIVLDREKRKDGPKPDTHWLKLGPVEGTESVIVEISRGETNSGRGDKLLSHIKSHFGSRGAYATQLLESSEMPKSTFYRALHDLLERGELINDGTEKRPFYKLATK